MASSGYSSGCSSALMSTDYLPEEHRRTICILWLQKGHFALLGKWVYHR